MRRFGKLQWTPARAVLIGAAALALLPLFAGEYWLNAVLIPVLAMSLAGIGLNLLMGYTGQASLGTGAFMAVGTYATYNFLLRVPELPLPISLVLGGLVAADAGVVFGLPSLRAGSAFGNLIEAGQLENLQKVLFGVLIIYLLIKEPAGLTALFGTLWRKLGFQLQRADEPAHSADQ